MSRTASSTSAAVGGGIEAALQILMEAAKRFVNSMPSVQRIDMERAALLDAITQAQRQLSVEHSPAKRARRGSKKH